ncbi:RAMP superfamily CRISPR-associated protein [Gordonia sp. NPDC058843]|uniref:RAMP superfamily CRISPR-associated protein n=1 Tax=Gordonia sp. NPDC058843 TaxID=3346648 RepID=UPI0036D0465F
MGEPLISAVFDLDITATTSIVHRDDTRNAASIQSLFRREKVLTPAGEVAVVPIISGNAWRGILRRTGETLLAEVLDYDGQLTPAAAHLLRNGGFLRKSTREMTPEQERELKTLVPLIGLFGGAANGRVMSGKLVVSKVVPVTADTLHLLPTPPPDGVAIPASVHTVLGQESTSHSNDLSDTNPTVDGETGEGFSPIRLDTETLIAGTRLSGQIRLTHATPVEYALLADILEHFATHGHLGGRTAAGHGRIHATLNPIITSGTALSGVDWRAAVAARRDAAIIALTNLT